MSTYGNGGSPVDGEDFVNLLRKLEKKNIFAKGNMGLLVKVKFNTLINYSNYKNSILHIFKVIEVIFTHEFDSDTISRFHPAHTKFKGQDPVAHTTVGIWSAA